MMKRYGKLLILVVIVLMPMLWLESDDKELFLGMNEGGTLVKPNVIILMDSSMSMNTAIYYPRYGLDGIEGNDDDGYNTYTRYSGTLQGMSNFSSSYFQTSATRWHARWILGTTAYEDDNWSGIYNMESQDRILCGSNGQQVFEVGDWIINRKGTAVARIKAKTDCDPVLDNCGSWLDLEERQGTFDLGADGNDNCLELRFDGSECRVVRLYGGVDSGFSTLYDRNYLKWLFLHAGEAHRAAVSHFSVYGTFDVTDFTTGVISNCQTPGLDRIKQVFTRIQVAREVACKVATDALEIVNLGLFRFDGANGGYLQEGLTDMSETASGLVDYKNKVYAIPADAWTPLAEALVDVWWYYRPGPASKPYWPVDMDTAPSATHEIDHWCQNNYVVIMTDGESTQDLFTGDGHFTGSIFTSKPVKRTEPWVNWNNGWGDPDNNDASSGIPANYDPATSIYCPNWTCWLRLETDGFTNYQGSDYLDDVAYFIANSDLFPEKSLPDASGTVHDLYVDWPGKQCIYTYTIGFNADNDLLRATAINGDGAFYTASNYDELVEAFRNIFTSILLRNFAFSAITAPKKTATALNEDLSMSYVGYFLPSASASTWEGHLLAYELVDLWGFDIDNNGEVDRLEFVYDTQEICLQNSDGQTCVRLVDLAQEQNWDAADRLPANRSLFTHYPDTTTLLGFTDANTGILQPLFGPLTTGAETQMIIEKIRRPNLADIFHADVTFVGPPHPGKKFLPSTNSLDPDAEPYEDFYEAYKNRRRVLFSGSNDGILHMLYADDPIHADSRDAGKEIWGFIPDQALPSLKKIVIDSQHTYTVDGRLNAQDIYYKKGSDPSPSWASVLGFGLRQGGNAYYQLDVTEVGTQPTLMWKFKDADYSGQSWGRPTYGRIRLPDPNDPTIVIDKWVVVLSGGFAFNYEKSNDLKGKAVFIVDAGSGELLWMVGYHPDGPQDVSTTAWLDTDPLDDKKYQTGDAVFNFPVPASLTAVDKDADGFLDAIYFGNTGGHFFKIDVTRPDKAEWRTYLLYKTNITTTASSTISAISDNLITVSAQNIFAKGQVILGSQSKAMGQIRAIDHRILTVNTLGGTFQVGEQVQVRSYDPIFISPAVALDRCSNIWIAFGTGDREHPRTNPQKGRFMAFKDNNVFGRQLGNLTALTWTGDTLTLPEGTVIDAGWYFDFYKASGSPVHEMLFDPEPLILPDKNLNPHIFMNTYTSPVETVSNLEDPCDVPSEGTMTLYDIALFGCGVEVGGSRQEGRIAGGGVYEGKEHIMFVGKGGVASVPPLEETEARRLPYPGAMIFWKEKKR